LAFTENNLLNLDRYGQKSSVMSINKGVPKFMELSNYPFRVGIKQIAKRITARHAVKEISHGS